MGILTLTIVSFLLGKVLKNLSIKKREEENKINFNKIIWASLGFYVGILI